MRRRPGSSSLRACLLLCSTLLFLRIQAKPGGLKTAVKDEGAAKELRVMEAADEAAAKAAAAEARKVEMEAAAAAAAGGSELSGKSTSKASAKAPSGSGKAPSGSGQVVGALGSLLVGFAVFWYMCGGLIETMGFTNALYFATGGQVDISGIELPTIQDLSAAAPREAPQDLGPTSGKGLALVEGGDEDPDAAQRILAAARHDPQPEEKVFRPPTEEEVEAEADEYLRRLETMGAQTLTTPSAPSSGKLRSSKVQFSLDPPEQSSPADSSSSSRHIAKKAGGHTFQQRQDLSKASSEAAERQSAKERLL
eukprot:TRINITY_DN7067_c0_g1_i1.p1 TRINITY_DN7067_c0_g1~~TRINITY_DN7067_c0_g1_i1.p1  ORF type:complete len:309 (+),score=79.48 TRINITY_DN7067_c0_g1_i1:205-1131(+)